MAINYSYRRGWKQDHHMAMSLINIEIFKYGMGIEILDHWIRIKLK